jgi:hypothetical protein
MIPSAAPPTGNPLSISSGASPHELFALTDEQILEIEPSLSAPAPPVAPASLPASASAPVAGEQSRLEAGATNSGLPPTPPEPPPWLAQQMNDPWSGDEARELWDSVQQTRNEAAAYREVFAKPEEARAAAHDSRTLKELYPGGIEQARSAADRARALEEIDTAFFGGAGKSPQEVSAGRAALAERMWQQDPAAFREMVFAGLRALESAGQAPAAAGLNAPDVAQRFVAASSQAGETAPDARLKPSATQPSGTPDAAHDAQLTAYRSFERAANEDLDRSVGTAIQRSLEQALPNLSRSGKAYLAGAPHAAPLSARLQQAVRDDVESALKSDPQLGEQLGALLSTRRFDESTRARVVRLINDRAQQLVPVAARRVIQEWTQTAFASHRGSTSSNSAAQASLAADRTAASGAGARYIDPPEAPPVSSSFRPERSAVRNLSAAASAKSTAADRAEGDLTTDARATARPNGRAIDYRKLTDEQILDF